MIAEYEATHSNIKIKIAEDIISAGSWEDALATAAAGGSLPDVALIGGLPGAVAKEWALDVSEYTKNDTEWNNVPESSVVNPSKV